MDIADDEHLSVVDAHFHIWDLDKFNYPWPSSDDKTLYKNYTIQQYDDACKGMHIKHAVFVQVLNNNIEEIDWLFDLAKSHPVIKGIVGGIDLTGSNLAETLDKYCKNQMFVGVRHILDFEKDDWMMSEEVSRGLSMLEDRGLTFDLLLRPHLLSHIPGVVASFPRLKFAINHIAKPFIRDKMIDGWKEGMTEIAKHPNVFCKISGLVTEADHNSWQKEDFLEYVKHIVDIFGEDRCMFGSDFPVFYKAASDYAAIVDLAKWLLSSVGVSEAGKKKIFRENAITFYNLKTD